MYPYLVTVHTADHPDYHVSVDAPNDGLARTRAIAAYPYPLRGGKVSYTVKLAAFTSLGCYPIVYLTRDGLTVCADCAVKADTSDPVTAHDVYWEGPTLTCDDCNADIDSAYGDPDAPGSL